MADAIILTGGVAKGAFGAGALAILANEGNVDIRRIVATSAGAINGAFLAAALRRGDAPSATHELSQLWIDHATFAEVFDISLRGLAGLEGLSTNAKVLELLRRYLIPGPGMHEIELRLVVTAMSGVKHQRRPHATTFERVLAFQGQAFEGGEAFDHLLETITASAAFPFAFLPVSLGIGGDRVDCYDGGLVGNAPMSHALGDPEVARVFIIVPCPSVLEARPADAHGVGLLAHLGDLLINERIYRDLRVARAVNRTLSRLEARFRGPERQAILDALGWVGRRRVEIVEIRPDASLKGNAFDGFFSRELREHYVRAGEAAARAAIAAEPPPQSAATKRKAHLGAPRVAGLGPK